MTFEEWADRTFGKEFKNTDSITYCRMSAAWEAAYDEGLRDGKDGNYPPY